MPNPRGRLPVEGRGRHRPEDPWLGPVMGQRDGYPLSGELVPPGARDGFDEPTETQAAQVVGDSSRAVVVERQIAPRRHRLEQVLIAEAVRQKVEAQHGGEQGLHPPVAEAERRGALAVDAHRAVQLVEHVGSEGGVVVEALDAEQASVGGEADLLQASRLLRRRPTSRSYVSLITVSVRSTRPSLWYRLMRDCL